MSRIISFELFIDFENIYTSILLYTFALLNRRLYNPEIAKGDFSDIKGNLSVAK